MNLTHPVFGTVAFDPEQDSNEWETEVTWEGATVGVDLTFDGAAMDPVVLDGLARFVSDIAQFDTIARAAMRRAHDEDADSAARLYIEHHREELGDATTSLAQLQLVRIGLYPDEPDRQAVFDYTLRADLTNYLLVATFDANGDLAAIDVES